MTLPLGEVKLRIAALAATATAANNGSGFLVINFILINPPKYAEMVTMLTGIINQLQSNTRTAQLFITCVQLVSTNFEIIGRFHFRTPHPCLSAALIRKLRCIGRSLYRCT